MASWPGLRPDQRPYRGTAWYYAEYRDRPSLEFARQLAKTLGWSPDGRLLDLGAGPAQVSLRLAPFVGEVVVMDPEPDMVAEGERRAAAAGARNLTFVVGGSDDLAAIAPELGPLAGAVISQAFHWLRDQDSVLRALDTLLDPNAGAVAIVGFVKEPDPNGWLGEPPWDAVGQILREHLQNAEPGPHPRGRHDPFPDILGRSAFPDVELITHEYDAVIHPSVEAAIGFQYTLSNTLAQLGDDRDAFEAEVRAALADADTSPIHVRLIDSALVGRRPDGRR
ncbi:MAG TPA: class I SAM-dependent methyltransferase [Gaiellaceae bacterium]|nr:class I SAM-dependent methyltransferase [Gaiellaceae bacterium]